MKYEIKMQKNIKNYENIKVLYIFAQQTKRKKL